MKKQKTPVADLAMRVLKSELMNLPLEITPEIKNCEDLKNEAACYILVQTLNGEIRACYGNVHPTEENLYYEIIKNAKNTIFADTRFKPIAANEIEHLSVSVDVPGVPYLINSIEEIDPKHKGIIVAYNGKKALLLPNLKGIETSEEQIEAAKQKAGLQNIENSELQISIFTSTRFE